MPDLGLTHVALTARDLDASIAFYAKYAAMAVVHRRAREGVRWFGFPTTPGPSSSCWSRPRTSGITHSGRSGISASPAGAGRRSIDYMPRPAARAGRHALRSMRATLSAIPRGLPTPTAIR